MATNTQMTNTKTHFKTVYPNYSHTIKWEFENFSRLEKDIPVQSHEFHPVPNQTWYLKLTKTSSDNILLHVCNKETADIVMYYEINISNIKGNVLFRETSSTKKLKDFRKVDLLSNLKPEEVKCFQLIDDIIVFNCTFRVMSTNPNTSVLCSSQSEEDFKLNSARQLTDDLQKILNEAISTDVSLHVDDVTIEVHMAILRARSPVFFRMFDHPTSEVSDNVVNITDISAPTMKNLLKYFYAGTKESCNIDETYELYYAADKYEVMMLRDACKNDLLRQIQVDNACRLLSLADRHADESFKEEVMKFISFHFKSIVDTESFKELARNETELVAKLLCFCSSAMLK